MEPTHEAAGTITIPMGGVHRRERQGLARVARTEPDRRSAFHYHSAQAHGDRRDAVLRLHGRDGIKVVRPGHAGKVDPGRGGDLTSDHHLPGDLRGRDGGAG